MKMKVNGKVMGSIMKKRRIIRLCCSMMLMGVLGIGQLLMDGVFQVSHTWFGLQYKFGTKYEK